MSDFIVERLTANRIALAYPLIREVAPSLDLTRWTRFATRISSARRAGQGGILVVRRPQRPYPCGLVCYRRDEDLQHAAVLTAEYFVSMDVLDNAAALEALVQALEQEALRLGCAALRSIVQGPSPQVTHGLLAAQHQPDGSLLKKVLERPVVATPDARCEGVSH